MKGGGGVLIFGGGTGTGTGTGWTVNGKRHGRDGAGRSGGGTYPAQAGPPGGYAQWAIQIYIPQGI